MDVNPFTKFAVLVVDIHPINVNFCDISGHWAEANVDQAVSSGIVNGYADGTFKPGKMVSQAEFVVMLMNTLYAEAAR
ncbi:S-layer homology domain-containing protein [Paenibacillus sp. Leaf72]|uniref:S-layer homology domain-containing protein n=1 Tax=Paenibacillus sp. Leaf72 TaxID=1736234 RepID=UPI0006FEDA57|nr:S-layer homology domain-containing protein [Paenibacillus sp. Leaf72]KQO04340.1 hypothetical protein ASF12_12380 [Paenibacillus sp. Leaf72]